MGKTRRKPKAKIRTIPWSSAAYLKTDEDIANYLEAVFEDGDPALINHAVGVVARAKGMTQIAKATGLGRESLYKALSPEGNPEFSAVLKVMRARSPLAFAPYRCEPRLLMAGKPRWPVRLYV